MKKLFTLSFAIAIAFVVNAQTSAVNVQASPDVLSMKETAFDFGTIPQGKPVYHFLT